MMVLLLFLFALSSTTNLIAAETALNCGTRSSDYSPLLRWPFHVALYVREMPQQEHYFCGGTLVGIRTVLTAAHCVIGYRTTQSSSKPLVTVHVGEYELNNPLRNGTAYHVAAVVIHPEYDVKSLTNDVAVLQLAKQVEFSRVVQPVCLWSPVNETSLEGTSGTVVTAIGWGMDVNERFSSVLTEITHPLPTKNECEKQFRSFLGSKGLHSIICARTSVCAGSGGSGLYVERNGRVFLRGIVSFGPKTDSSHRCGVNTLTAFVNISLYTEWIQDQVRDNSTLDGDYEAGGESVEVD